MLRPQTPTALLLCLSALSLPVFAQEENTISTEIEFGAIVTSGNSDDQNVKFKGTVDWNRGDWIYGFSSDGFRSSKNNRLNAQRLYHVGRAGHNINEFSFINARVSYEDDRFSGFDSQSDFSVNYGRNMLRSSSSMTLAMNVGLGMRRSVQMDKSSNEAIGRVEGNYVWNLSPTAFFTQDFSLDSGSDSSIYRSESGIQSQIMDNLSLRFSIKIKHQTQVPVGREKTDTETAATLVLSF
jgi:putative salt-induced outer membrane protein